MKRIIILTLLIVLMAVRGHCADTWNEHKSTHFVVFYRSAPIDFVKTVATQAERYYSEISNNLGLVRYRYWSADDRAQIFIFDDAKAFIEEGGQSHWASGSALTRAKIIRTFPAAHGFFDSTLPHELGHILFREFIGHDVHIPLWFEEGVAMYQEKAKRWGANREVKKAIEEGTFMTIDELTHFRPNSRTTQKKVELFYAEAASIVYYLMQEQGKSRFTRLCHKLKDDVLFEEALKSVYIRYRTFDDLNKAWVNYLK